MPRGRFNAPRDPVTGRFLPNPPAVATPAVSLEEFARELRGKAEEVPEHLRGIAERSTDLIVKRAKANVQKTAPIHNAGAWRYIDAEVSMRGPEVVGTVGYNTKHKPARLGNLLEFGNGGDPSPAHWDLARALESEEDRFYDKLADMAEGLLESRWGSVAVGKDLR